MGDETVPQSPAPEQKPFLTQTVIRIVEYENGPTEVLVEPNFRKLARENPNLKLTRGQELAFIGLEAILKNLKNATSQRRLILPDFRNGSFTS